MAALAPVVPFGEETGQFRQMRVEPKALVPLGVPWGGRILALLLALLAVGALWRAPDSLIMPFSWQDRERTARRRA